MQRRRSAFEFRQVFISSYLTVHSRIQSIESSTDEIREKLRHEYMSVQRGFENMASEWENGRVVLESYLAPTDVLPSSPIASPTLNAAAVEEESMEESEGKGIILDAEDVADILNLPLASKASVFEAIAGVVEKNGKEKAKKTRQERIEEMKLKRAKQVMIILVVIGIYKRLLTSGWNSI